MSPVVSPASRDDFDLKSTKGEKTTDGQLCEKYVCPEARNHEFTTLIVVVTSE